MELWTTWLSCVWQLRSACSRQRTFLWMVVALAAMSTRGDLAGVTSFIRSHWLVEAGYLRLLHFFHTSAVHLDALTRLWTRLALRLFRLFLVHVNGKIVLISDGIKIPKEGRKMPGVKLLHQESSSNAKADYIMGHSCQAVSLLVKGIGLFFAVPLACRIHEGLVFSNRTKRTLLDRMIELIRGLGLEQNFYLLADAYYATKKIATPLLQTGDHLITRLRTNAVGYWPAKPPKVKRRGRPRKYGTKVKLRNLFRPDKDTKKAFSTVYGENRVQITYRCLNLLWKPLGGSVRIVAISHPVRGKILLMSTDLTLDPMVMLQLYGLRFKIEVGFKQAVHTVGTFAYRFWMENMKKIKRGSGNQYLHRTSDKYRNDVRRKMNAYHRHIQIGIIAQGLLHFLSLKKRRLVWRQFQFGSWFRTMNTDASPSELVVTHALRNTFPHFSITPIFGRQEQKERYIRVESRISGLILALGSDFF